MTTSLPAPTPFDLASLRNRRREPLLYSKGGMYELDLVRLDRSDWTCSSCLKVKRSASQRFTVAESENGLVFCRDCANVGAFRPREVAGPLPRQWSTPEPPVEAPAAPATPVATRRSSSGHTFPVNSAFALSESWLTERTGGRGPGAVTRRSVSVVEWCADDVVRSVARFERTTRDFVKLAEAELQVRREIEAADAYAAHVAEAERTATTQHEPRLICEVVDAFSPTRLAFVDGAPTVFTWAKYEADRAAFYEAEIDDADALANALRADTLVAVATLAVRTIKPKVSPEQYAVLQATLDQQHPELLRLLGLPAPRAAAPEPFRDHVCVEGCPICERVHVFHKSPGRLFCRHCHESAAVGEQDIAPRTDARA